MSMSFCVLGSGSKGNATAIVLKEDEGERYILIDCGLSMRATARQLAPLGVELEQISAVLLTHLDSDHFQSNWVRRIRRHKIPIHICHRHRSEALHRGLDGGDIEMFNSSFDLGPHTCVEPVRFAHDDVGSCGFIIEHRGQRLGFATDLGRVPDVMLKRFVNLHALAIESNYDLDMQNNSNRPIFLKRRIMGGMGHLSNEQSLAAAIAIAERSNLSHVVTLHLSEQCNDPRLVKRLYAEQAPHLLDRLTITNQRRATPMLHVTSGEKAPATTVTPRRGEQIAMF